MFMFYIVGRERLLNPTEQDVVTYNCVVAFLDLGEITWHEVGAWTFSSPCLLKKEREKGTKLKYFSEFNPIYHSIFPERQLVKQTTAFQISCKESPVCDYSFTDSTLGRAVPACRIRINIA